MLIAPPASVTPSRTFHDLFLAHQPASKACMNGPHTEKKYTKIHQPLTNQDIIDHLAGKRTYAIPLIGADGLAVAAAIDVDSGGEREIKRLLAITLELGFIAFGTCSPGGDDGHNGGHIWILFDRPANPVQLRQVAERITQAAGITAETYPTRKALRLPLGIHRWSKQRGVVLFQDGTPINLDIDPDDIVHALTAIAALPRNTVDRLPTVERPTPRPQHEPGLAPSTNSIQQYNQQTNLINLLEGYGGKVATRYPGGGALIHCPCGNHAHGDQHPSLEVKLATNSKYGRYIAVGYAPNCAFYTETGQVIDAFGIFCHFEKLTAAEAVKRLAPPRDKQPRKPCIPDPEPEAPRRELTPYDRQRRATERQQRIGNTHVLHAEIRARAESDSDLPIRARTILYALLERADNRDWCRPSVARLVDMTGLSEATVHRALRDLKQHGYIEDDQRTAKGGQSTTIRRFLRVSAAEWKQPSVTPENRIKHVNTSDSILTCEAPRVRPVPEAVAEPVIAFEGGASYTPVVWPDDVPTREWQHSLPPKAFYAEFVAPRERELVAPTAPEQSPAQVELDPAVQPASRDASPAQPTPEPECDVAKPAPHRQVALAWGRCPWRCGTCLRARYDAGRQRYIAGNTHGWLATQAATALLGWLPAHPEPPPSRRSSSAGPAGFNADPTFTQHRHQPSCRDSAHDTASVSLHSPPGAVRGPPPSASAHSSVPTDLLTPLGCCCYSLNTPWMRDGGTGSL